MSSMIPAGSSDLLRHRSFLLFLLSRSFSRFSSQIAAVAIGWQVYDLTGSAFDLGMVGLVQFLPTLLLVFVAGHAADLYRHRGAGYGRRVRKPDHRRAAAADRAGRLAAARDGDLERRGAARHD